MLCTVGLCKPHKAFLPRKYNSQGLRAPVADFSLFWRFSFTEISVGHLSSPWFFLSGWTHQISISRTCNIPSCVGAAFHLLVPKQIGFTNSLQILQGNDVAAQNLQKDVQCRIKHCRPSAKNFLCLIPQQDPRLLDVTWKRTAITVYVTPWETSLCKMYFVSNQSTKITPPPFFNNQCFSHLFCYLISYPFFLCLMVLKHLASHTLTRVMHGNWLSKSKVPKLPKEWSIKIKSP